MRLLDEEQLAALRDLAGDLIGEMREEFAASSRRSVEELREALERGDLAAAAELSHRLKGGAASFGLAAFRDMAASWEQGLRGGQVPQVGAVGLLGGLLEESLGVLETEIAGG